MKAHPEDFVNRFRLTSNWRTSNMVAFDAAMKIVKYSSVGQILEAFFVPRLASYEVRRLREMERLESEAVEADAKARFIRAVLTGSIDLRRASDAEIVGAMQKHSLPALGDPGSVDGYEYLLRLRMDRVKATAVEDAEKAVATARAAVAALEATTAGALWLNDLEDFEAGWEKMVKSRTAATGNTVRKVYVTTKKPKKASAAAAAAT